MTTMIYGELHLSGYEWEDGLTWEEVCETCDEFACDCKTGVVTVYHWIGE